MTLQACNLRVAQSRAIITRGARPTVRPSTPPQEPRLHVRGRGRPGARHRRQHRHFQRGEFHPAAPASLPRAGSPGESLRSQPRPRLDSHRHFRLDLHAVEGPGKVVRGHASHGARQRHRDGRRRTAAGARHAGHDELLRHARRAGNARPHLPPRRGTRWPPQCERHYACVLDEAVRRRSLRGGARGHRRRTALHHHRHPAAGLLVAHSRRIFRALARRRTARDEVLGAPYGCDRRAQARVSRSSRRAPN